MKTDRPYIEQLVEGYFDCTLSEQQERELRHLLATTACESEAISEARAVMGIFATARALDRERAASTDSVARKSESSTSTKTSSPALFLRLAAGFALAIAIAATLLMSAGESDICVMYANGQQIESSDAVLAQMHHELSAIASADENIDQALLIELQTIGAALDEIEQQNN